MEINVNWETLLLQTLKKYWGYSSFRPNQLDICISILKSRDVFVHQSTGSGKSLVYQLPSVLLNDMGIKSTSIVVSPLLSLIEDQLSILRYMGIPAGAIGGDYSESDEVNAKRGNYVVLYCTPEKLCNWESGLRELASHSRIVCIAIDESHCVSEWGNVNPLIIISV